MNMLKHQLTVILVTFLSFTSSSAQDVTGRWELRGSYLTIGYALKWKILKVKTPTTGYKASTKPVMVEFHHDGRVDFGKETSTYTQNGNRLIMEVGGSDTDGFDFELRGQELRLWMRDLAAGLNKQEAKAIAVVMAKQMGIYEQFSGLEETDDVYQVQVGMIFDYKGPSSNHNARGKQPDRERKARLPEDRWTNGTSNNARNNCSVPDSDLNRIIQKTESMPFDDEKLAFLRSAITSKKCFSTAQVSEMLALLTFDKEKLPLAKIAYQYVTDPDNYYELEEAFDFMDSKSQFRAMLK